MGGYEVERKKHRMVFLSSYIVHGFGLSCLSTNGTPNCQHAYRLEKQLWLFAGEGERGVHIWLGEGSHKYVEEDGDLGAYADSRRKCLKGS